MELATSTSSLPEERLLIRELMHRTNNEFASVANMLSLAANRAASAETKSISIAVLGRLEGYRQVHRAASAYLRELCRSRRRARAAGV